MTTTTVGQAPASLLQQLEAGWLGRGWDLSALRGFRMEADGDGDGGSGDGGQGGDAGSGDGGAGGDSGAGDAGQGGDDAGSGAGGDAQDVSQLPDWAQKLIKDTRSEAASNRTKAKSEEDQRKAIASAVAKALGLETDDKPDPEVLARQLSEQQAENRRMKVEAAFAKAAKQHQADEDLTLAVLHRNGSLADLDPAASDFPARLSELVKDAVKANPKLKATQAAGKSGSDFDGAGGGTDRPKTLHDAVAARIAG